MMPARISSGEKTTIVNGGRLIRSLGRIDLVLQDGQSALAAAAGAGVALAGAAVARAGRHSGRKVGMNGRSLVENGWGFVVERRGKRTGLRRLGDGKRGGFVRVFIGSGRLLIVLFPGFLDYGPLAILDHPPLSGDQISPRAKEGNDRWSDVFFFFLGCRPMPIQDWCPGAAPLHLATRWRIDEEWGRGGEWKVKQPVIRTQSGSRVNLPLHRTGGYP
ncbi:hypothetical protein P170DRAFT_11786 [Aspergillus steynii IBT 23096]|uniref:Uncharacterized protein n=1 Tax=Aspergillus steynii IBT 23096 TaxID=1392250 RepID=A0A2I2GMZ3_9EURO|nr:uncharacterized protein P170DRAFT_11786 [Aspergillus steynii IBT 23096]PLB54261.1 hypothetical protein P170DRAFT_11786 [Aspergillus steynii IBT 23096]